MGFNGRLIEYKYMTNNALVLEVRAYLRWFAGVSNRS
jgi:hypothetical protein